MTVDHFIDYEINLSHTNYGTALIRMRKVLLSFLEMFQLSPSFMFRSY